MGKSISVSNAKNKFYFTDILDKYANGKIWPAEDKYNKEISGHYKMICDSKKYYLISRRDRSYWQRLYVSSYLFKGYEDHVAKREIEAIIMHKLADYQTFCQIPINVQTISRDPDDLDFPAYNQVEILYEEWGTPLSELIDKISSAKEIIRIAYKTLEALIKIHSRGFFHAKISPESILYDEKGTIKISKFSHAVDFGTEENLDKTYETKKYTKILKRSMREPETSKVNSEGYIINENGFIPRKIDVFDWAFAFYSVFSKDKKPWQLLENLCKIPSLYKTEFNFDVKYEDDPNGAEAIWFKKVLIQALDCDPNKRPNFKQIKERFDDHLRKIPNNVSEENNNTSQKSGKNLDENKKDSREAAENALEAKIGSENRKDIQKIEFCIKCKEKDAEIEKLKDEIKRKDTEIADAMKGCEKFFKEISEKYDEMANAIKQKDEEIANLKNKCKEKLLNPKNDNAKEE